MKKIGITLNIDVTKIDKTRLYSGHKGTYLDLTTFIDFLYLVMLGLYIKIRRQANQMLQTFRLITIQNKRKSQSQSLSLLGMMIYRFKRTSKYGLAHRPQRAPYL